MTRAVILNADLLGEELGPCGIVVISTDTNASGCARDGSMADFMPVTRGVADLPELTRSMFLNRNHPRCRS
jgi:hypothetical protein